MTLANWLMGIVALLCAIWVIYMVLTKHKHWRLGRKAIWIICAIIPMLNIATAVAYYFVEYKKH